MRFVALALGACLLAACASKTPSQADASPVASPSPSAVQPDPSPSPPQSPSAAASHVFLIVMENRSYSQAISSPYMSQLATRYGAATDYHGISHPSLPNYLALTSGSTWGIADDGYHALPAGGLGAQLTNAGISWRAYMEGMTHGCFNSPYPYALKHNPFAYYGGACPSEVVPFTTFAPDLSGDVPRFTWISPGLCHDGHDCSTAVADAWLSQAVAAILASSAWKDDGFLFITWDEGEDAANSVLTLVIHQAPIIHKSAEPYNHYSLLATIEDMMGVSRLGEAANASPMVDLTAALPVPRLPSAT